MTKILGLAQYCCWGVCENKNLYGSGSDHEGEAKLAKAKEFVLGLQKI